MRQDIKLYINDMPVDFSSELSMPFNYQLEDTSNPTIVKNMFTKTINIVGTKNNNKIFGDIYEFDRNQLINDEYLTGAYFNPSKRTPFQLFRDGELIESGYMQLNSITLKNKVINYQITLFGGIGDFFFNLSYNQDNEPLTLSDLKYNVRDKYGKLLEPDREMDFRINADVVNSNWEQLRYGTQSGTINDYIAFIPSYNGVYENFDNNKVLINTHNSELFGDYELSKRVDGETYNTYNGYVLAELNDEFTEWSMRDLRSYEQRCGLKVSKLFEAISNPDNNGGYNIELDSDFFNKGNSYYNDAYITLPLFTTILRNDESNNNREELNAVVRPSAKVGTILGSTVSESLSYVFPTTDGTITSNGQSIDATNTPVQATFDVSLDFQLSTQSNTTADLYDGYVFTVNSVRDVGGATVPVAYNLICATSTFVQVVVEDINGNVLGFSNVYEFNNLTDNAIGAVSTKSEWIDYQPKQEAPITKITGNWKYDSKSGKHYFVTDKGNTYNLTVKNINRAKKFDIKLYVWRCRNNNTDQLVMINKLVEGVSYSDANPPVLHNALISLINDDKTSKIGIEFPSNNIYTNALITKQSLLKTEKTPCDYLLSYCKLFGLYFSKDTVEKTIKIQQRNNYFTNEVIDWGDRIDYSQDIKITPMIFNNKFYRMSLNGGSDYFSEKYRNEYGIDYGQKRINTNYNFNADTTELLDGNVFNKSVPVLGTNKYYRNFYNEDGKKIPAFMVNGLKYKLYNQTTDEIKTTDIDVNTNVNLMATKAINIKSGYDLFEKECYYKLDNEKETLNDISNCLLFFCGMSNMNTKVTYWLTDDVAEMGVLNNNKPCYLYTESTSDANNNFIGYAFARLPQFLSVKKRVNNVIDSFDFATPKEIYMPNTTYSDESTIYHRYWSNFYNDQLDINTKKVEASVNLGGVNVNSDTLRNFYFFGGSNWILNKINDYEPNKEKTTKCEFIKVQNPNNYTTLNNVNNKYIDAVYNNVVDYYASQVDVIVKSNTNWKVGAVYSGTVTPTSGTSGETIIRYRYNINDSKDFKELGFSLLDENDKFNTYCIVRIKQLPNLNDIVVMSGTVKYLDGIIEDGTMIITDGSNATLAQTLIQLNSKYDVFYPLATDAYINIYDGGDLVHTERFRYVGGVDFVKDITINTSKPAPKPDDIVPTNID